MSFNIRNFKASVGELLRPFSYEVNIQTPGGDGRSLSLRTESISLPGVSFAEVDVYKPYGNGLTLSIPHSTTIQEITCVHNIDGEGETLQAFYDWANQIVNIDGNNKFSAYYYNQYADKDGKIYIYKLNGDLIKTYTLKNIYPASYDQVQMSWGSTGEIAQLSVTYKFESFTVS